MTPAPTAALPSGTADIVLSSNLARVAIGQQFNLTVTVNAGPNNPVDAAQIYLDFDRTILQAVDITPSTALSETLQSRIDNNLGQIGYAAGTLGASAQSPFALATIRFISLAPSGPGGTTVRFAPLVNPRRTKSVNASFDNTGNLGTISIVTE